MANKYLKTRIIQRYDTIANWKNSTVTLLPGEVVFDDSGRYKIGDGVSTWSDLPYGSQFSGNEQIAPAQVVGKIDTLPNIETINDTNPNEYQIGTIAALNNGDTYILVETDSANNLKQWVKLAIDTDVEVLRNLLQTSIVTLEEDLNNKISAVDARIDSEVSTINGSISDIDTRLTAVESSVSTIESGLGAITGDDFKSIGVSEGTGPTVAEKVLYINSSLTNVQAIADAARSKVNSVIDENSKIKKEALPSYVDDVIEGFVGFSDLASTSIPNNDGVVTRFFVKISTINETSTHTTDVDTDYGLIYDINDTAPSEIISNSISAPDGSTISVNTTKTLKVRDDTIYVDIFTNKTYRWSGSRFVVIASDLAIGETQETAFAGDRGVTLENSLAATNVTMQNKFVEIDTELQRQKDVDDDLLTFITAKVQEINNTIDGIIGDSTSSISDLTDSISTLDGKVDNLITEVSDFKADYNQQTILVNNINTALNSTMSAVESIQSDISSIKTNITNIESELDDNTAAIAAIESSLINYATISQLNAVDEKVDLNSTTIAAIQSAMQLFATKTELNAVEEKVDLNTTAIASIQSSMSEYATKEEVTAVDEKVKEVEEKADTNTTSIAALGAKVDEVEEDVAILGTAVQERLDNINMQEVINNSTTTENGKSYVEYGDSFTLVLDCGDSNSF